CTAPPFVPVPKASRVTSTFERPSTTGSIAVRLAATSGSIPAVAMAPAARPVLRKLRRVIALILTSALKPVGEPNEWMLARLQIRRPSPNLGRKGAQPPEPLGLTALL